MTNPSSSSTSKTNVTSTSDVESDLGTLIINGESDADDNDKTLKPAFLQHFERTSNQSDVNQANTSTTTITNSNQNSNDQNALNDKPSPSHSSLFLNKNHNTTGTTVWEISTNNNANANHHYNEQSASQNVAHHHPNQGSSMSFSSDLSNNININPTVPSPTASMSNPMSRAIMLEGDFEFLRYLSVDELRNRMATLDIEMEAEIEELRRRYAAKRQPILDAMDNKKKRQQTTSNII